MSALAGMVVPLEFEEVAQRWRDRGVLDALGRQVAAERGQIAAESARRGCGGRASGSGVAGRSPASAGRPRQHPGRLSGGVQSRPARRRETGSIHMTRQENTGAVADSVEVRERLVEALNLDLIGPWGGHTLAAERLPGWVRTVELVSDRLPDSIRHEAGVERGCRRGRRHRRDAGVEWSRRGVVGGAQGCEEGLLPVVDGVELPRGGRGGCPGRDRALGGTTPRSKVPTGSPNRHGCGGRTNGLCRCRCREPERIDPKTLLFPDSGGLTLHVDERVESEPTDSPGFPQERGRCRFFWSTREPRTRPTLTAPTPSRPRSRYAGRQPFVPRPDPRGAQAADWDDRVADLHYADTPRVRHRPRRIRGLGGRGASLPDPAHGVDPKGRRRGDEDRGRARCRAVDGRARGTA